VTRRRSRLSRTSSAALLLTVAVASSAGFTLGRATRATDDLRFPHARHAKLFPTCGGCHAGIMSGDSTLMFPPVQSCTECHNGRDVKAVAWAYPRARATNLRFQHARHAQLTDSAGTHLDCARCHGDGPSVKGMLVARAQPETCVGCHVHEATSHLAPTSPCATCHLPLVRATALSDSAVAALPKPPSHASADFITSHGIGARTETCATCHSRESCARCHVNAATLQPIAALGSDARIARLLRGKPGAYPVPANHLRTDFVQAHGGLAVVNAQTCATCHAQVSCLACHMGSLGARTIGELPRGEPGGAAGVQLRAPVLGPPLSWPGPGIARVVRVHALDFMQIHGPVASTGRLDCAGCHQQALCTSCHQGSGQRRFHPFNFVARHPSESYARETKCASCHNTEVFCRSCHRDVAGIGAASKRRAGTAHAAQPLWLLQHGEAARRGMPGCATCHQQTDCLQCHSTFGGRINPHGPNFNAAAMRKRNPTLCSYCHIGEPR
jgi:hypothetical protein